MRFDDEDSVELSTCMESSALFEASGTPATVKKERKQVNDRPNIHQGEEWGTKVLPSFQNS